MNYHEQLGKLYHQLMLNEEKCKQNPDKKEIKWETFSNKVKLTRKIEDIMTKELRKKNSKVIGVCNVRSVSIYYSN